jgi:hypothetical protein
MGLDASNHVCIYTSGGITRIEGYTGGVLNSTVTNTLGIGGDFEVRKHDNTLLFDVDNDTGSISGLTLRQAVVGNAQSASLFTCSSGGDTHYMAIVGRTPGDIETTVRQPWPLAQLWSRIRVQLETAMPAGQSGVFTVRQNASNTALGCTVTAGNSTCTGSLGVGSEVSVAQDSLMSLSVVCSGGSTQMSENISWGIVAQ